MLKIRNIIIIIIIDIGYHLGVTYDSHRNTIYWTNTGFIVQLQRNGGNTESNNLNEAFLSSLGGIAVDYIGQRLYWIRDNTV